MIVKRMRNTVFALFIFSLIVYSSEIVLKEGKTFKGDIISENKDCYVLNVDSNRIIIDKETISEIDGKPFPPEVFEPDTALLHESVKTDMKTAAQEIPVPAQPLDTSLSSINENVSEHEDRIAIQEQNNILKEKVIIAVNTLGSKGIENEEADIISERLRVEMVKTGRFNVMERAQMVEILQEQNFQQSDLCSEQSCVVEMGQLLGVERIVTGTVGKLGKMHTFSIKMINVRTGQIMYSVDEDCECPIEQVLTKSTKNIADKFAEMVRKERFGGVKITSNPTGALILLNGSKAGSTPWSSVLLLPGKYKMDLVLPSYDPVSETWSISEGQTHELSYKLKHTAAFTDSLKAVKEKKRKKVQWIRRIGFGSLMVAFGTVGGIKQYNVSKDIDEKEGLVEQYNNAQNDPLERERLLALINKAESRINSNSKTRNGMYICAGACAIGLGVSIFF